MNAIDLFCGAGGFSVGLVKSGFNVVFANDINRDACSTYKVNHPNTHVFWGDISQLNGKQILEMVKLSVGDIDIVVGGPPCQGFSTVGKKNENDPRNNLFFHYFKIVEGIEPKMVLFENVTGLKKLYSGRIYEAILKEFERLGYRVDCKILNALNYGVPQNRERIFIIGYKPEIIFKWPLPTHGNNEENLFFSIKLQKPLTFCDAVSDLPFINAGESADYYSTPPQNEYQAERRKNCFKLTEHVAFNHGKKILSVIEMVPPGGSIQDVPEKFRPQKYFTNTYARLWWDRPATTITRNFGTPSSSRCIHPKLNRGLTAREGARLQSFDDDYIFIGSRSSKKLQIGNAVPPLLAEAILKEVYKSIILLKDGKYGRQERVQN